MFSILRSRRFDRSSANAAQPRACGRCALATLRVCTESCPLWKTGVLACHGRQASGLSEQPGTAICLDSRGRLSSEPSATFGTYSNAGAPDIDHRAGAIRCHPLPSVVIRCRFCAFLRSALPQSADSSKAVCSVGCPCFSGCQFAASAGQCPSSPERLPRRAKPGLGARSPHQIGPSAGTRTQPADQLQDFCACVII